MTEGEAAAYVAAATGVAGAAGGLLGSWWKKRKEDRADALIEYQKIVHELRDDVGKMQARLEQLQTEHTKCQIENAKLGGEIQLLQAAMQRLQQAVGDKPPPATAPVIITCKPDGTIVDVNQSVSAFFHYLPGELLGKNVDILIPERYKERHQVGLKKAVEQGWQRWQESAIVAFALDRNGGEVAVTISLTAWQNEQQEWFITAQIHSRKQIKTGSEMHRSLSALAEDKT